MEIFIYDNNNISLSIMANTQQEADRILAENVKSPSSFQKESSMNVEDIEFN